MLTTEICNATTHNTLEIRYIRVYIRKCIHTYMNAYAHLLSMPSHALQTAIKVQTENRFTHKKEDYTKKKMLTREICNATAQDVLEIKVPNHVCLVVIALLGGKNLADNALDRLLLNVHVRSACMYVFIFHRMYV